MNANYIVAVSMAIVSSSSSILLVNMLLKKKLRLSETLRKYYGIEPEFENAKKLDRYSLKLGQSLADGIYHLLQRFKLYNSTLEADLAICNEIVADIAKNVSKNLALSVTCCVATFVMIAYGILRINLGLFVVLALIIVIGLGVLPIFSLKQKANQIRENSLIVISAYLDLVGVCLAGGMGLEESLTINANIGNNIVMERLKSQFALSNQFNEPLWTAFTNVSKDLNLPLLREVASIFKISGSEGAKIKASITRKAQSLREKRLIKEESEANSVTERLFFPSVLLLLGFLIFVGYPAIQKIFTGL